MKDQRLTPDNFLIALTKIGGLGRVELFVNQFLVVQAHAVLGTVMTGREVIIRICSNQEMPPGYEPRLDATVYFPWGLSCGDKVLEFSGWYDTSHLESVSDD